MPTSNHKSTGVVALLDVDETLITNTNTNTLNEELIKALLDENIRDIYLNTNMSLGDIVKGLKAESGQYLSRPGLVEELEQRGFTVHGVITPADPAYGKGPGAAYAEIFLPQHQRLSSEKDQLTLGNYKTDAAYINASTDFKAYSKKSSEESWGRGYETAKGLMTEYFLQHKPNWVQSFIFFDDDRANIAAVEQLRTLAPKNQLVPFTTCYVDKNNWSKTPYKAKLKQHHYQSAFEHEHFTGVKFICQKLLTQVEQLATNSPEQMDILADVLKQTYHLFDSKTPIDAKSIDAFVALIGTVRRLAQSAADQEKWVALANLVQRIPNQAFEYQAKEYTNSLGYGSKSDEIKAAALSVYEEVRAIRQRTSNQTRSKETLMLTAVLEQTLQIANADPPTQAMIKAYAKLVNQVKWHPSLGSRLAGTMLTLLSVAAIAAGISFALLPSLGVGLVAGVSLASTGAALGCIGMGLFAHGRRKGLSKQMDKVLKAAKTAPKGQP